MTMRLFDRVKRTRLVAAFLLIVLAGHLLVMASPWHGLMLGSSGGVEIAHAPAMHAMASHDRMALVLAVDMAAQLTTTSHSDCAVMAAIVSRWTGVAGALALFALLSPVIRPIVLAAGEPRPTLPPPRHTDPQADLQVFRL
jgi:hypothetical protein